LDRRHRRLAARRGSGRAAAVSLPPFASDGHSDV